MVTNDLKPCPFCGGKPRLMKKITQPAREERPFIYRCIICGECGASTGWFNTNRQAKDLWNRRAE